MHSFQHRLTAGLPIAAMVLTTALLAQATSPRTSGQAGHGARYPSEVIPARDRAAAVRLAAQDAVQADGGVPLSLTGSCPVERLEISYRLPGTGWQSGAYISPLGPEPTAATTAVNGVVLCAGSRHAFVGFTAELIDGVWDVELVPDPAGGLDGDGANEPDHRPAPPPSSPASLTGAARGPAIEGYARYEGQSLCDPAAKPGAVRLRDLLLSRYRGTSSLGISRPCSAGGPSEHKEGRAFDWGVSAADPVQREQAASFVAALTATDAHGNRHALARRMGVMYVIWDGRIWSAYRADAGWRSYTGSSRHTDHVHVSLSWAGALARTSFWSGRVVTGFVSAPTGSAARTSSAARPPAPSPRASTTTGGTARPTASPRPSPTRSPQASPGPSPTASPTPAPTPIGGLLTPFLPG